MARTFKSLRAKWKKFTFEPCVECDTGTAGRCHGCGKPLCGAWSCTETSFGLIVCPPCHENLDLVTPEGISWDESIGRYVDESGMLR